MKKHLFKAIFLVMVMFFHSFVLVPKSYATTWEGVAGRLAFRAFSPSTIMTLGSGTSLVIGAAVAGGVGYLIYKSGAVTALKDWWNSAVGQVSAPTDITTGTDLLFVVGTGSGSTVRIRKVGTGSYDCYNGNPGTWVQNKSTLALAIAWLQNAYGSNDPQYPARNFNPGGISPPTSPLDYISQLVSSQPSLSNYLFGSPGVAAAVFGGAAIVSAVTMPDADADRLKTGLGATPINNAGVQEGSPPTTTDNTVTAGDTASIGLLQQIVNFVSNLLGIRTSAEGIKTTLDNSLGVLQQISGKLDNAGSFPQSAQNSLDNIAGSTYLVPARLDNIISNTGAVPAKLDNLITTTGAIPAKLDNVINTITELSTTQSAVQTRMDALKDVALTKFPFSVVAAFSITPVSGSSTYSFASLPLAPGIEVPINPLAGPMGDFFVWVRSILVWLMWAGVLFMMLKKVMEV